MSKLVLDAEEIPQITVLHTDDGDIFRFTFDDVEVVDADATARTEPLTPREIAEILLSVIERCIGS